MVRRSTRIKSNVAKPVKKRSSSKPRKKKASTTSKPSSSKSKSKKKVSTKRSTSKPTKKKKASTKRSTSKSTKKKTAKVEESDSDSDLNGDLDDDLIDEVASDLFKGKPATFDYEFGGPIGAVATSIMLPLVCYGFVHFCDAKSCPNMDKVTLLFSDPMSQINQAIDVFPSLFTIQSFAVIFGWFFFQIVLERFLPGSVVKGSVLKGENGKQLLYNVNGHAAYWFTFAAVALWQMTHVCNDDTIETSSYLNKGGEFFEGIGICSTLTNIPYGNQLPSMSWLDSHFIELLTASLMFSTVMSIGLYIHSLRLPRGSTKVAAGGDSGVAVYDFFMGRELNPRMNTNDNNTFDLKYFCELRPGLIGWCVLNFGMLCSQIENNNSTLSGSMVLINIFQLIYVWDALYNEKAILTTMDITTDGFGMMLAFGDLTWVPFTYTLQSRYLVHHDPHLSNMYLFVIIVFKICGYVAFRGSNGEKDKFRTDPTNPNVAHLETITTHTGRKLLVSGWWGMARKINYSADWLMGLCWCSVCGTDSIIPYFYSIYFAILLIHRAMRDDHACHEKYGKDWIRYKKRVPYVFIPGII